MTKFRGSGDRKKTLLEWIDKQETDAKPPIKASRYLLRLLCITIRQFNSNELSLRSGALTYTVLLALVPMIAMSTAVVKGLGGGDQLREAAYTYLDTLDNGLNLKTAETPVGTEDDNTEVAGDGENMTRHLRSAVDQLFDYVDRTNFATLGTFGVVGILLSVLLVLSHIESAMNAIWKVPSGRSPLRKLADYLTLLILFPISINVAFAAGAFLKTPSLAAKMDIFIPFEWIQTLVLQVVPIFFIALTFYAMYIFFPNTKVKAVPAAIGATLAAFAWFAVQNLYIGLQVGVAKNNAIYGSFATLPLFLVWMYLGWMFILTGAQVAFALQNADSFRLMPTNNSPSLRLSTAFDIMEEIYEGFESETKITQESLPSSLLHYPRRLVDEVIAELLEAGIIDLSSSDERLLPLVPYTKYNRKAIVQIMLGIETPDTSGGKTSRAAILAAGISSNTSLKESAKNTKQKS